MMKGISLILLLSALPARAVDWPRWRGPRHDGISRETGWLDRWPEKGPPIAWRASVGTGFSSVSVADGRLFTMGNVDNKDTVYCLDAATGKKHWSHTYDAPLEDKLFEGGPTSTPTVAGDRVFTLSRWGDVFCFDAASGRIVWSRNVQKETGVRMPGWGFAGSPLVHQEVLLLNIGAAGMALDVKTGKVVWTSENEEAGYSSPLPFRQRDEWFATVSSGEAYSAVNIRTGKPLWQARWITRYGLNAVDPILHDGHVFVSAGYNKGAALLKPGDGEPTIVWKSKNLRNQLNCSVLLDGFLYGIDGDTNTKATLRCVEWKTGEVRWTQDGIGAGSLMAADGKLIVLSEAGELLVAPATPDGFKPTGRAKVLDGKCWTVPVLANGRIYCRNARGELVCADVLRKP